MIYEDFLVDCYIYVLNKITKNVFYEKRSYYVAHKTEALQRCVDWFYSDFNDIDYQILNIDFKKRK